MAINGLESSLEGTNTGISLSTRVVKEDFARSDGRREKLKATKAYGYLVRASEGEPTLADVVRAVELVHNLVGEVYQFTPSYARELRVEFPTPFMFEAFQDYLNSLGVGSSIKSGMVPENAIDVRILRNVSTSQNAATIGRIVRYMISYTENDIPTDDDLLEFYNQSKEPLINGGFDQRAIFARLNKLKLGTTGLSSISLLLIESYLYARGLVNDRPVEKSVGTPEY